MPRCLDLLPALLQPLSRDGLHSCPHGITHYPWWYNLLTYQNLSVHNIRFILSLAPTSSSASVELQVFITCFWLMEVTIPQPIDRVPPVWLLIPECIPKETSAFQCNIPLLLECSVKLSFISVWETSSSLLVSSNHLEGLHTLIVRNSIKRQISCLACLHKNHCCAVVLWNHSASCGVRVGLWTSSHFMGMPMLAPFSNSWGNCPLYSPHSLSYQSRLVVWQYNLTSYQYSHGSFLICLYSPNRPYALIIHWRKLSINFLHIQGYCKFFAIFYFVCDARVIWSQIQNLSE